MRQLIDLYVIKPNVMCKATPSTVSGIMIQ